MLTGNNAAEQYKNNADSAMQSSILGGVIQGASAYYGATGGFGRSNSNPNPSPGLTNNTAYVKQL